MQNTTPVLIGLCVVTLQSSVVKADLPPEINQLFKRLDDLGRSKIQDASFKELNFGERTESAWVIEENATNILALRDDLSPWVFAKKDFTKVPSSWRPQDVRLKSVSPRDFEAFCRKLINEKPDPDERRNRLYQLGPSYRALIAHAAWKKGLTSYTEQILAGDPIYKADSEGFVDKVWEDLAWLHFLRGVNLLMFADRKDVVVQLQLVVKLAPKSEHGRSAADLLEYLEKMVETEQKGQTSRPAEPDTDQMTDIQKAEFYVSQFPDVWCQQMGQPGSISPYEGMSQDPVGDGPPAFMLRKLGYAAVPALIKAMEDNRPTRTVYHWRDFHHSRLVWRVSDFAWTVLRDISKREFGYRPQVGFTFSYMKPEEKRAVIEEVKRWYAETKNLSPDDRMMKMFSSRRIEDWLTAGKYFAAKKDRRPVPMLIPKLKDAGSFDTGKLCEMLGKFGDPAAIPAIKEVLVDANEASDRISAAIALWTLGDNSGVPVAIEYVKAEKQPYGTWDTPVWFLMRCHTKEAIAALKEVVETAPPQRAGEVIGFLTGGITGELWSEPREPAGSPELAGVLVAGMRRSEEHGGSRLKDHAAAALALLRDGGRTAAGQFAETNPDSFDQGQTDPKKRDKQIEALLKWHEQNKGKLVWDSKGHKLKIGVTSTRSKP